jgi:prepilin-type N-terminal cleavage/methylation domain-containing protein
LKVARESGSAGFTIIELLIALALFLVLANKASVVLNAAGKFTADESATLVLDDQAHQVLDRIAAAILGTNGETLIPDAEAPAHSSELLYQVLLGVEEGQAVWSDPEQITLSDNLRKVLWRQNPDTPGETRVVWSNLVRPYLEGEVPNGADDNGNDLVDENGLTFVIDRNRVTVQISLTQEQSDGRVLIRTLATTATCRNIMTAVEP